MLEIEKKPISDQVLNYLRKKILLQEFEAGEHLKESVISEELNVSRGPVREAISQLEREGLVERPGNGRAMVQEFKQTDIRNLYESRILLETYALTVHKPDILNEEGHLLYEHITKMGMPHSGKGLNADADLEFHYRLVRMAGNKTLTNLWLSMNDIIKTLIEVTSEFTAARQKEIVSEHTAIAEAVLQKKTEEAQLLLRKHLEGASDFYSKAVFDLQKGR